MTEIVDASQLRICCTGEIYGGINPRSTAPKTVKDIIGIAESTDNDSRVVDGKGAGAELASNTALWIDRNKCPRVRPQEPVKHPVRIKIITHDITLVIHSANPRKGTPRRRYCLEL